MSDNLKGFEEWWKEFIKTKQDDEKYFIKHKSKLNLGVLYENS